MNDGAAPPTNPRRRRRSGALAILSSLTFRNSRNVVDAFSENAQNAGVDEALESARGSRGASFNLSDSAFECGWQQPFAFLTGVSAAAQYTHAAAGGFGLL